MKPYFFVMTAIVLSTLACEMIKSELQARPAGCRRAAISGRPALQLLNRIAQRRLSSRANNVRQAASPARAIANWRPLFDGTSLKGWKITNFGGEGDVSVKDRTIEMDFGSSLTGVTYTGEFPRTNYEVRLEAMRIDGIDFFCGMTFPVGESYCSFIVAGWAGAVVGLSSIDGKDASENETTKFINFDNNRWYRIRVRVTPKSIQTWIDDKQIVNANIVGRKISTRNEVDLSKPFGISAWETRAALRNIEVREIEP